MSEIVPISATGCRLLPAQCRLQTTTPRAPAVATPAMRLGLAGAQPVALHELDQISAIHLRFARGQRDIAARIR